MSIEKNKVRSAIKKSQVFLLDGIENHLSGNREKHPQFLINPCPLATALGIMASEGSLGPAQKALSWLRKIQNEDGGWGIAAKLPSELDSTALCLAALEKGDTHPDERARRFIEFNGGFSGTKWFTRVILCLSDRFTSDKIALPIPPSPGFPPLGLRFMPAYYFKLYPYRKDMLFSLTALEMLAKQRNVDKILGFLETVQGLDGSWDQDVITTSLATMAFQKGGRMPTINPHRWLSEVQYSEGGWPSFNQLACWDIGWASSTLAGEFLHDERLYRAREYLENGMYLDGSFGSTLPHGVPDIDDTAAALEGLVSLRSKKISQTVGYLKSMQNKDGSWSTFPEYYGKPPYCFSGEVAHEQSADITCRVLNALVGAGVESKEHFVKSAIDWLVSVQKEDGSWETTWFNSDIYATSEAAIALHKLRIGAEFAAKGLKWLASQQCSDGSFGKGTVEETAISLTALLTCGFCQADFDMAAQFLIDSQNSDGSFKPSFSGVYAFSLYYNDPMYSAYLGLQALKLYDCISAG